MFFRRRSIFLFLIPICISCQKKATGPPPRYAVVRFENLTGDAALEWVARAAPEVLARSLAGAMDGPVLDPSALTRVEPTLGFRPAASPGISSERQAALGAGATRILSGYVERAGSGVRAAAAEEDVASHKTTRETSAIGPTPLAALNALARQLSPDARPRATADEDALRLYATGLEENGDSAGQALEQAVAKDPDFGPAWTALAGAKIAHGERDAALDLIAKARRQKLDQLDRANIDLAEAALNSDAKARVIALEKISAMSPGDTVLLRSLAESEMAAGRFRESAEEWNKLAALLPNDANAWNQLGYTRAWSGDYQGGIAALKEYGRLAPNDPNVFDSTGDVNYMYRQFAQATASYQQAYAKEPQFQRGGDLYKAAWAKFKAGDRNAADAIFAQFHALREKAKDASLPLFYADWLYRTGRQKDAMALLRKTSGASGPPAIRAAAFGQLAVWDLLDGNRAAAIKDAEQAGQPTSPALLVIRFAAMPSASAQEWEARANRMMPAPQMERVRTLALAYALLFDGKQEAAIEQFEKAASAAPGTDFFVHAVYAKLNHQEQKLELVPDPNQLNEFAPVLD